MDSLAFGSFIHLAYMIDGGLLGGNLNFQTIISRMKYLTFDTQMILCRLLETTLYFEGTHSFIISYFLPIIYLIKKKNLKKKIFKKKF